MSESKQESKKVLRQVTTARGSTYTYLPDGRTQRYKAATQELKEPQDLLLFIPPWEKIGEKALQIYPKIFNGIENWAQYEETLLGYFQSHDSSKTIRAIDSKGNEITSNSEALNADRVFIAFVDRKDQAKNFTLPVSMEPKPGYYSFDFRKYKNENNETLREKHMGNKVIDIQYQDENNDAKPAFRMH
jgi:hypothetical protein